MNNWTLVLKNVFACYEDASLYKKCVKSSRPRRSSKLECPVILHRYRKCVLSSAVISSTNEIRDSRLKEVIRFRIQIGIIDVNVSDKKSNG